MYALRSRRFRRAKIPRGVGRASAGESSRELRARSCETSSRARGPDTISLCPFYGGIMEGALSRRRRTAAASRSPPRRQVGRQVGPPGTRAGGRAKCREDDRAKRGRGGGDCEYFTEPPRNALDYANNGDLLSCLPCRRESSARSRRHARRINPSGSGNYCENCDAKDL